MKEDDYEDRGYYDFKPFRIELQGSCELRIPLTDSEIQKRLEEEEKNLNNEENS